MRAFKFSRQNGREHRYGCRYVSRVQSAGAAHKHNKHKHSATCLYASNPCMAPVHSRTATCTRWRLGDPEPGPSHAIRGGLGGDLGLGSVRMWLPLEGACFGGMLCGAPRSPQTTHMHATFVTAVSGPHHLWQWRMPFAMVVCDSLCMHVVVTCTRGIP